MQGAQVCHLPNLLTHNWDKLLVIEIVSVMTKIYVTLILLSYKLYQWIYFKI